MNDLALDPDDLETEEVVVRSLVPEDLDWIVRIDEQHTDHDRSGYLAKKLEEAERDTGVKVSFAALVGDQPAGFLMARVYYGEFGRPETFATIDTLGVDAGLARKGVARALMRQLLMNLNALRVERLRTQVEWDQGELIAFFRQCGFQPAPRLSLEMGIGPVD